MKGLRSCWLVAILLMSIPAVAQTVSGKWYGVGNANMDGVNNNYLIELILVQNGSVITGEFNYYFKSGYFPNKISGNYDSKSRKLHIKTTPVTYYRSAAVNGVECSMDGDFTLLISKAGNSLKGKFSSTAFYTLTCPDILMNLTLGNDDNQQPAPIEEEKEADLTEVIQKETAAPDAPATYNNVSSKKFSERTNVDMGVIEVDSANITIEIVDNGEIDKDSVSIFFNSKPVVTKLELTKKGSRYQLSLDQRRSVNEISMFAENLGHIAPNTAVLIVYDGAKRYEISLTSTLQTNGTVRLKKKQPVQ